MNRPGRKASPRVKVTLTLTEEAYKYANAYIDNISAFVSKCICNYGKKCAKEEKAEESSDDSTAVNTSHNIYFDKEVAEIVKMKWVTVDD